MSSLILSFFYHDKLMVLGTGVFFELLWLDFFPAGTYIPPNRLFPFLITIGISNNLQIASNEFYILLALSIPFAYLGSYIERLHRTLQNKSYDKVVASIKNNTDISVRKIKITSTIQYIILNVLTFFMAYILIYYMMLIGKSTIFPSNVKPINWPILWSLSMIGGVLSIRIKEGYMVLISGSIVMGVVLLLGII